jgi:hypothetical protein
MALSRGSLWMQEIGRLDQSANSTMDVLQAQNSSSVYKYKATEQSSTWYAVYICFTLCWFIIVLLVNYFATGLIF